MELAGEETTPDKNHQDNGASPPHGTQPSSPYSPLTDDSVATDRIRYAPVLRLVTLPA